MAKAILKFDLSNPDDSIVFKRTTMSLDLTLAIFDILQLRKKLVRRYENQDNSDETFRTIQEYADEIVSILDDHRINIDDILR